MPDDVLRHLTSTVGLVCSRGPEGINVMSAEWSYFVARSPMHIAVGISDDNWSGTRIAESGEFSVTLCDSGQAALAVFCGSVSGREVDKTSSGALRLEGPHVIDTPHVGGGLFRAECRVRHIVDLPGYVLAIGEVVWRDHDEDAHGRPLVKHGSIHELGPRISDARVIAGARLSSDGREVRVAATSYEAPTDAGWDLEIRCDTAGMCLREEVAADGPALVVDVALPLAVDAVQVVVSRADAPAGHARATRHVPDSGSVVAV